MLHNHCRAWQCYVHMPLRRFCVVELPSSHGLQPLQVPSFTELLSSHGQQPLQVPSFTQNFLTYNNADVYVNPFKWDLIGKNGYLSSEWEKKSCDGSFFAREEHCSETQTQKKHDSLYPNYGNPLRYRNQYSASIQH